MLSSGCCGCNLLVARHLPPLGVRGIAGSGAMPLQVVCINVCSANPRCSELRPVTEAPGRQDRSIEASNLHKGAESEKGRLLACRTRDELLAHSVSIRRSDGPFGLSDGIA